MGNEATDDMFVWGLYAMDQMEGGVAKLENGRDYFIKDDKDRIISASTGKLLIMHSPMGGYREKFQCVITMPSDDMSQTRLRLIHKPSAERERQNMNLTAATNKLKDGEVTEDEYQELVKFIKGKGSPTDFALSPRTASRAVPCLDVEGPFTMEWRLQDLDTWDHRKHLVQMEPSPPNLNPNLSSKDSGHLMSAQTTKAEEWRFIDATNSPDYPDGYGSGLKGQGKDLRDLLAALRRRKAELEKLIKELEMRLTKAIAGDRDAKLKAVRDQLTKKKKMLEDLADEVAGATAKKKKQDKETARRKKKQVEQGATASIRSCMRLTWASSVLIRRFTLRTKWHGNISIHPKYGQSSPKK